MMDESTEIAGTARKRKPKPYDVRVKTSGEWYGTVDAISQKQAVRLAREAFDEGELRQCGEEIEAAVAFRPRRRVGSWRTFESRFKPIDGPDGAPYWPREQLPKDIDVRCVWTIVDGGNGKLYVSPGYRFVNRIDYVVCAIPRRDEDDYQPDYRYD